MEIGKSKRGVLLGFVRLTKRFQVGIYGHEEISRSLNTRSSVMESLTGGDKTYGRVMLTYLVSALGAEIS